MPLMEHQLILLSRQVTWPSVCGSGQSPVLNCQLAMVLAGHLTSRVGVKWGSRKYTRIVYSPSRQIIQNVDI